LYGYIIKTQLT